MERKEDDEVVCLDESFFINDNYQLTTFTFGSQVLELYCLQSASTDYDLTGQLVWPGALLLNSYLSKNSDMLQGCSVIELGSGVGHKDKGFRYPSCIICSKPHYIPCATGILCSQFCKEVVLTDHSDEVLKILKKNIDLHKSLETGRSRAGLVAEKLEWGNPDYMSEILQKYSGGFDLVLGADICFQHSSVPPLFDTVEQLLHLKRGKQCKFILAYVSRAKNMDSMVKNEAIRHGMQITEVPGTRSVVGNLEGVIFEITLM